MEVLFMNSKTHMIHGSFLSTAFLIVLIPLVIAGCDTQETNTEENRSEIPEIVLSISNGRKVQLDDPILLDVIDQLSGNKHNNTIDRMLLKGAVIHTLDGKGWDVLAIPLHKEGSGFAALQRFIPTQTNKISGNGDDIIFVVDVTNSKTDNQSGDKFNGTISYLGLNGEAYYVATYENGVLVNASSPSVPPFVCTSCKILDKDWGECMDDFFKSLSWWQELALGVACGGCLCFVAGPCFAGCWACATTVVSVGVICAL